VSLAATAAEKTTRRKIVVIHNPSAGWRGRQRYDATIQALREAKREVTVLETQKCGDAEAFARKLTSTEADVVVAAGGDGTINEVVNGLYGRDLPLAILPLGTVNLLAREIGLASDAASVAATILSGRDQLISLGRANGRLFFAMASAGVDARVVDGLDLRLKRFIGRGAYAVETIHQFALYDSPPYRVTINSRTCEAAWVVVAKGRYYGGPFELAPQARLTDPSLHVCLSVQKRRTPESVALHGGGVGTSSRQT